MPGAPDLMRQIAAGGALADPAWQAAFAEVPRELFVPYYYVAVTGGGRERLWREDPDPRRRQRWLEGVYDDAPLATRVRDGELLSSSSQPSLMARMLEALEVRDGMRVLEIGTGSGYNAALLSHRLGSDHVVSVDLDPAITSAAKEHLAAAGYRPRVVTGDGALGVPAHAPYDRVIATCEVPALPVAWLAQCVPGALILAPLATGLLALRVEGPGSGQGRFLPTPAFFVPLRGGGVSGTGDEGTSGAGPAAPGIGTGAAAIGIGTGTGGGGTGTAEPGAALRGVPRHAQRQDSFHFLLGLAGGSAGPYDVYELWRTSGRPERERYGVTVRDGAQWAWLDDPDGPHIWPLGG
ncbi:methyltransferase domain-containing protein [Streptomyces marispadix]|uniref:Protein-L-isoaspartate O-methyltransferase n=1 Tax=Streptomyces marispadix TaxID=2922868 RepID=A0ABS9SVM1_9ACTN|nr:methyltransferase domain-containing protein [Streptomyces marispadix]MCH6160322.1 methyltransferase domain-containing protein [Streptomyces marispadix]